MRPPSPDQVHRLLDYVEDRDPDFATYLWLAASTGARRSQLLGLRWTDIDVAHAAIGFTRAFVEGPTGPVLRATKSDRVYSVAIDNVTIRRLVEHRRRSEACATAHGLDLGESAFVFSSRPDGSWPWLPNGVTKTFLAHRRHAGVGRFRLHDLRHFMATQMLTAGVPVPTVSERLGHARASTTLNIYGHSVPGADHAAAEFIATLIAPRRLWRAARWATGHVVDSRPRGVTRHDEGVKQRHVRPGDELRGNEIIVIRGGDLDPEVLRSDALRYYWIYGTYGISVFAPREVTVDEPASNHRWSASRFSPWSRLVCSEPRPSASKGWPRRSPSLASASLGRCSRR